MEIIIETNVENTLIHLCNLNSLITNHLRRVMRIISSKASKGITYMDYAYLILLILSLSHTYTVTFISRSLKRQ